MKYSLYVCVTMLIAGVAPAANAQVATAGYKQLVDCVLVPQGVAPSSGPNLSILLPSVISDVVTGRPALVSTQADPIKTADNGSILNGLKIESVNHFKAATFSLVSDQNAAGERYVVYMQQNSSGGWYDAALGKLRSEPTLFGACFFLVGPNAEAGFNSRISSASPNK